MSQETLSTLFGLDGKAAIVTGGTGVLGAAFVNGVVVPVDGGFSAFSGV